MTINEVFEKAINEIKGQSMYAGQFYSPQGVVAIIEDIQKRVVGNNVIGVIPGDATITVTTDDVYELVNALEERISDNIDGINESDIVDTDSLEASISGNRISIDSIDVDKDLIVNEAQYNLDDTITKWMDDHKILIKD